MKIAYVTPYLGEEEIVNELLADHEVAYYGEPIREELPEELRDAAVLSVFVDSRVSAEMIDSMPNLKVLALRSTGCDHVDVAHAQERGIAVANVPHYGSQTVAEYAFGLMLTLSRRIYSAYDLLRREGMVDVPGCEGFDLCGKTLGVIGTGAIGRRVCEMAKGFRMRVVAFDLFPNEEFANELGIEYRSYDEVLEQSDIVTFHVPATDENHHMLNGENIARMKPGACVINTARGSLIDTIALVYAVKSGHLGGAGIDVFEGEQYIKDEMQLLMPGGEKIEPPVWRAFVADHELIDHERVIVTPHLAFNTKEAKREITETTVENITSGLAGEIANPVHG